jgi:ATP-dependent Zn protease
LPLGVGQARIWAGISGVSPFLGARHPSEGDAESAAREFTGTVLAAHEAGHAIVAVLLRLSLQYVTLRPQGPQSALTYTRTPRNESPDYLERQAVCYLAGIAADQLLNGRVTFGSDIDDRAHAKRNAERLGVEDVQEFLRVKKREAEAIVSANRVAVEAVRRALVARRTLRAAEVRAIIAG